MPRIQLTDREDEVLRLAIGGLSNDQIAARLAISRRTVEAHMRTLFRKTGVSRRGQLAALYQAADLQSGPPAPEQPDGADSPGLPLAPRCRVPGDYERQLRDYAGALRSLVDRQVPLFEERVELTALVGERDGQDLVIERRWTTPRPYLVYRILCPIVPWPDGPSELEDLVPECTVPGQDIQVEIHGVRDGSDRLHLLLLFQPGLQGGTEWVLRYRSPGLWSPLRGTGRDSLDWATATFDQRHPATTSDLALKVVFPVSWTAERLIERSDLGTVHTERLPTGQVQLSWHHDTPHVGAYHWCLEGSPAR